MTAKEASAAIGSRVPQASKAPSERAKPNSHRTHTTPRLFRERAAVQSASYIHRNLPSRPATPRTTYKRVYVAITPTVPALDASALARLTVPNQHQALTHLRLGNVPACYNRAASSNSDMALVTAEDFTRLGLGSM